MSVGPKSTSEWTQTLVLRGQAQIPARASSPLCVCVLCAWPALVFVPSPGFDVSLTHPSQDNVRTLCGHYGTIVAISFPGGEGEPLKIGQWEGGEGWVGWMWGCEGGGG